MSQKPSIYFLDLRYFILLRFQFLQCPLCLYADTCFRILRSSHNTASGVVTIEWPKGWDRSLSLTLMRQKLASIFSCSTSFRACPTLMVLFTGVSPFILSRNTQTKMISLCFNTFYKSYISDFGYRWLMCANHADIYRWFNKV